MLRLPSAHYKVGLGGSGRRIFREDSNRRESTHEELWPPLAKLLELESGLHFLLHFI